MIESRIEKAMKPIPVPYEEFESFPKHVEEFFDMIARRPFELLEKRPLFFGRELENLLRSEPELTRPILMKLYETEENLIARAEGSRLHGEGTQHRVRAVEGNRQRQEGSPGRGQGREERGTALLRGEVPHLQEHQAARGDSPRQGEGNPEERVAGADAAESGSREEGKD